MRERARKGPVFGTSVDLRRNYFGPLTSAIVTSGVSTSFSAWPVVLSFRQLFRNLYYRTTSGL